ncbi:MAG: response regulator, partial [Bacteroidales bacterium]
VVSRTSSMEALEEFKAAPEDYSLVITDQTMPNMTGVELARALLQVRKDLPIILCTGFSDLVDEEKAKKEGIKQYVLKPIVMKEMANAVRSVLDC